MYRTVPFEVVGEYRRLTAEEGGESTGPCMQKKNSIAM